MRRPGYIVTTVSIGLTALMTGGLPAFSQNAEGLRPAQIGSELNDPLAGPATPETIEDDTFAQTLPRDDALEDPVDRILNRNASRDSASQERRRPRSRRRRANAVPDLSESEIPQIPNGIPDRPFDLTTLDPQTSGSTSQQPAETADGRTQTQAVTPADPYAPLGIRSGSFLLFPELEISGIYTDNVGQDENNEKSAAGIVLRPGLTIQSNWARHSARLALSSEHTIFPGESSEDRNELSGTLDLRFDVNRVAEIEYSGRYTLSQDSSDGDSTGATTGTSIDHELGGDLTLRRRNARFMPSIRAGVDAFIFGDEDLVGGGTQNNSDRDYVEPEVELRLTYAHTRAVQPYVAATYSRRMHKQRLDRNGLERDSDGYELKGGVDLELGVLVTGNIELGYGVRDYEDASLKTTGGPVGTSRVVWNPTPLTTLALTASGSIDETSSAGASAIRSASAGVALTHRFRRNLTGTAGFTASFGDYVGIRRLDETYQIDLGLAYALTRNVEVTGRFNHVTTKSTVPGQEYSENQLSAGILFRL
ncbi:MAG: outer membrane beta-barrel protein [Pseudomonadota bacterium]